MFLQPVGLDVALLFIHVFFPSLSLCLQFYCLPDNYEVIDPSLEDIKVLWSAHHALPRMRSLLSVLW